MKVVNQASTIKQQNELLLLDLLIDYSQFKQGNVSRLKKDLPELKELVGTIYGAAEIVDGTFDHKPGKLPIWSDVSRRICRDYPDAYTRLTGIEKKLSANEKPSKHLLKEIFTDLVLVTNKVIGIHFDILRIPIPKPPTEDGQKPPEEVPAILDAEDDEAPTIWDINSLKRMFRNSQDFKPRE